MTYRLGENVKLILNMPISARGMEQKLSQHVVLQLFLGYRCQNWSPSLCCLVSVAAAVQQYLEGQVFPTLDIKDEVVGDVKGIFLRLWRSSAIKSKQY